MASNRQCPECNVTLTRYQWSKLWWMSSVMSGRLVQPCAECGAKLRLSSMTLVSSAASICLIGAAILYFFYPNSILLFVALAFLLIIFVATLATRVEILPLAGSGIGMQPESISKNRL